MNTQSWVDLDPTDFRNMLISLIGYRFGERPEERLDDIRAERSDYASKFLRMAGVRPQHTVLEIGSGCGFGTRALSRAAGRVIACDISEAYLDYARRECAEADNVSFHHIENRDLAFVEDGSVDAVVSISVFIHLNLYDIYLYFVEFHRVLKPGGKVVFDFADMNRLFGKLPAHGNNELFLQHAGYYADDPTALPGLVQWNSARGIHGAAKAAGFRRIGRKGHKLLFERRESR
jgi:ubiquinone/menaquinone biosynthesis C-methylase UbiE